MRPALAALRSRLSSALDSAGARGAVTVALLAGMLVLAGSLVSYWFARDLAQEKEISAITLAAADEAERLAQGLESFSRAIATLAADASIASSVVDSEGRNRHLEPVLRLVQSTLVRQFAGQSVRLRSGEPAVAVLDYRGRWLLGSRDASAEEFQDATWIQDVAKGSPRARYDETRRVLYIAHPVIFPTTGTAEGILVGIVRMADGAVDSTRSPRWTERFGSARDVAPLTAGPKYLTAQRHLALPEPLAELPLVLAIGISHAALESQARAILRPHLMIAVIGILAASALGAALGRQIGQPIMRLAEAVHAKAPHGGGNRPSLLASAAGGSREVRLLARALDTAFDAARIGTAQAHLAKTALDAAPDGVVIVDMGMPDYPLIYVNPAFERITGYRAADVLGRNLRFLHAKDAGQPGLGPLRDAIRDCEPHDVLLRNWRKDDTPFWNQLSVAPVRDADGQVTHFVGMQKDVSEHMRAEEHLRNAQKLEALGQLTGGLAHDFNNLLGIVIGNLDLLTELLPEGAPERARCDTALKAALRGADVTRSLLAVARRQRLEPYLIDVNERLREMLPLVGNTVGRRVHVCAEFGGGPMLALVDAGGLDTTLLNLALNARDAMSESGGTLCLRTTTLTLPADATDAAFAELPPGHYVRIDVVDSGRGMSEAVRERAFEPFFTTKPSGQGTGLGLSMAYGFARQSGGTAILTSASGRGTTASVVLPAITAAAAG